MHLCLPAARHPTFVPRSISCLGRGLDSLLMLGKCFPQLSLQQNFMKYLHYTGESSSTLQTGCLCIFLLLRALQTLSLSLGVRGIGFFCSICTRKCLLPCLCFVPGSQNYMKYIWTLLFLSVIYYSLSVIKVLSFLFSLHSKMYLTLSFFFVCVCFSCDAELCEKYLQCSH